MTIILDVILVAIFAAFVFFAAKKGFAKTLLELVAVVVAIVLAYQFSSSVGKGIYDSFVKNSMIKAIERQIDDNIDVSSAANKAELTLETLPDFVVSIASSAGVDIDDIREKIAGESFNSTNLATELVEKVAEPIAVGALTVVSFLLLAVVLIFVFKFIAGLISNAFKIPLVGTANMLLGALLGACKGLVVVALICTILKFLFANGDGDFTVAVNESFVIGLLDEKITPFIESLKEMLFGING